MTSSCAARTAARVATIFVASDRRDRQAPAVFVDLIVWEGQAEAAAKHLVKGQGVSFSGRFDPRDYTTSGGEKRLALEVRDVALEYGAKPRSSEPNGRTVSRVGERGDRRGHPLLSAQTIRRGRAPQTTAPAPPVAFGAAKRSRAGLPV